MIPPKLKGSYVLVNRLLSEKVLKVGSLGSLGFATGFYFYCGSARGPGGLKARINHHLRPSPRPTWHFDYLKPYLKIEETWFLETPDPYECRFVKSLAAIKNASQPVRGFGSQDCHSECISHLVYFPPDIKVEEIFQLIKNDICGMIRTDP